jgi:hypothetical protein
MKKIVIALITILVIVLLLDPIVQEPNLVSANFYPVPSLYVLGPSKVLYGPTSASFNFSCEIHVSMDATIVNISYSIDGKSNVSFTEFGYAFWQPGQNPYSYPNNHKQFFANIDLYELSFGNHTLKVYAVDEKGWEMSRTMDFLVTANSIKVYSPSGPSVNPSDYANSTPTSTPTPSVTKATYPFISGINISEPKNTTYFSEENLTLEINFTAWVHYNINYFVTYILDGENNSKIIPYEYITNDSWDWDPHVVIIKGSVALPKLSEGMHNITVLAQAQGSATTSSSSLVTFVINTHSSTIPSPTIEPSLVPTTNQPTDYLGSLNQIIPAAIVTAIVIAAAITSLIIFKRHKRIS